MIKDQTKWPTLVSLFLFSLIHSAQAATGRLEIARLSKKMADHLKQNANLHDTHLKYRILAANFETDRVQLSQSLHQELKLRKVAIPSQTAYESTIRTADAGPFLESILAVQRKHKLILSQPSLSTLRSLASLPPIYQLSQAGMHIQTIIENSFKNEPVKIGGFNESSTQPQEGHAIWPNGNLSSFWESEDFIQSIWFRISTADSETIFNWISYHPMSAWKIIDYLARGPTHTLKVVSNSHAVSWLKNFLKELPANQTIREECENFFVYMLDQRDSNPEEFYPEAAFILDKLKPAPSKKSP